jgi:general secretion pathway protein F
MPNFQFVGLDHRGQKVSGQLVAENERAVIGRIKEMGYFPTDIRALDEAARPAASPEVPRRGRRSFWVGGVRSQDIAVFSRQLANLIQGGLPMLRSLEALVEHTENDRLREALIEVHDAVKGGASLHESLMAHPKVFPTLYTSMVRAGEASGQLGVVLSWLAQFQEKEQARRSQVRAALAYPMLLVGVGSTAVFLLLTFLVPRFAALFQEFNQALPLPTVVLMQIAAVFSRGWWALLLAFLVLRFAYRQYRATPAGKYRLDALKLRLPVVGSLVRRMAVARFARTLATLLRGGVPILEALEVVRDVLGNERMARAVDEVQYHVREGESLAEQCRRTGFFPAMVTHMIALGEETGDLQGVLETVADTYDVEVDNALKGMISLLEPLIILTMGGIVGFVVAAMLLPIFQMNLLAGL